MQVTCRKKMVASWYRFIHEPLQCDCTRPLFKKHWIIPKLSSVCLNRVMCCLMRIRFEDENPNACKLIPLWCCKKNELSLSGAAAISARSQRSHGDLRNDWDSRGLITCCRANSKETRITTNPSVPAQHTHTRRFKRWKLSECAELRDPLSLQLSLTLYGENSPNSPRNMSLRQRYSNKKIYTTPAEQTLRWT